jgi:hypothetical protein
MEEQEGTMMFILVCQAAIACLMLLMPLAAPGYSQETTGTILGRLVDQTGTVVPAVKHECYQFDFGDTDQSNGSFRGAQRKLLIEDRRSRTYQQPGRNNSRGGSVSFAACLMLDRQALGFCRR